MLNRVAVSFAVFCEVVSGSVLVVSRSRSGVEVVAVVVVGPDAAAPSTPLLTSLTFGFGGREGPLLRSLAGCRHSSASGPGGNFMRRNSRVSKRRVWHRGSWRGLTGAVLALSVCTSFMTARKEMHCGDGRIARDHRPVCITGCPELCRGGRARSEISEYQEGLRREPCACLQLRALIPRCMFAVCCTANRVTDSSSRCCYRALCRNSPQRISVHVCCPLHGRAVLTGCVIPLTRFAVPRWRSRRSLTPSAAACIDPAMSRPQ